LTGIIHIGSFQQEDGEPGYFFTDPNFNFMQVEMVGSAIRDVQFGTPNANGIFARCDGAQCTGVTVSDPDVNGGRRTPWNNTTLRAGPADVKLPGLRTVTLNGTVHHFPPLPSLRAAAIAAARTRLGLLPHGPKPPRRH